jgi:hypothetical protein
MNILLCIAVSLQFPAFPSFSLHETHTGYTSDCWCCGENTQIMKYRSSKFLVWVLSIKSVKCTHMVQFIQLSQKLYDLEKKMFVWNIFLSNMYWIMSDIQWCLGLRVTWSASVLQDKQKILINFNLINERCLAIWVLYYLYALSAEHHLPLGIVGKRLACSVSVGIPHSYSQHSC